MDGPTSIQLLQSRSITVEEFAPFGQVIFPNEDGKPFDQQDAQLRLDNGTPRFYLMRLQHRGRRFSRITRHQQCTQCLGALGGQEWLLAVAPPHPHRQPDLGAIAAFRIPGHCFVKLELGTWHAGPYFEQAWVDFYNLELSDTNVVDHETCNLIEMFGTEFEIV